MNFSRIKKVAAVHDLSCFGRCSLTVIMPILSCMRVQVCPLPTALLSTHLGGFKEVAFHDLTGEIPNFFNHWLQEGINFDCIYSGFLASAEQIDVVSEFIDRFSTNSPLVLVDPVMGDDGRLYSTYTAQMQEHIRQLVRKADVITPNYTEACFLLGESYRDIVPQPDLLNSWMLRLSELGPQKVVITGVPLPEGKIATLCYENANGHFSQIVRDLIPAKYPGTGDIFASVLLGALLEKNSLPDAMKMADLFVAASVQETFLAGTPTREGVLLENNMHRLCRVSQNNMGAEE